MWMVWGVYKAVFITFNHSLIVWKVASTSYFEIRVTSLLDGHVLFFLSCSAIQWTTCQFASYFWTFGNLMSCRGNVHVEGTGECCLRRGSSAQDLCPSIVSVSQSYVSQGWFLKNGSFNYALTVKERALFKHINLWVLYFNTVVTKTLNQFGRKWKVM